MECIQYLFVYDGLRLIIIPSSVCNKLQILAGVVAGVVVNDRVQGRYVANIWNFAPVRDDDVIIALFCWQWCK